MQEAESLSGLAGSRALVHAGALLYRGEAYPVALSSHRIQNQGINSQKEVLRKNEE